MITPIRNQPINFLPIKEAESCLCDPKVKCSVLDRDKDWLSFQIKNPASDLMAQICADEILKVSNTFTVASAPDMTQNWMTYDAANERFCTDLASAGGSTNIQFTVNHFVSGRFYRVRALISNSDPGSEHQFATSGGLFSDTQTGDGWHEWTHLSAGDNVSMSFFGSGSPDCCIDEMEIYEIGANLSLGAGWTPEVSDTPESCGLKFCHDGTGSLTNALVFGYTTTQFHRYRINLRITGLTAGSLTLTIGDFTKTYTSNGYYTEWHVMNTAGQPTFTPTADFDGCVEILEFGEQATDHGISVYDTDDNFITNLFGAVHEDVFTVFDNASVLPVGCYYICIWDGAILFGQGGDLFQGAMEFTSSTGWTLTGGMSIGGGTLAISDGGTAEINIPDLQPNSCYRMEIAFSGGRAQFAIVDQFRIELDGVTIYSCPDIDTTGAFIHYVSFITGAGPITGDFELISELGTGTDLEIDYIRLTQDPACTINEFPGDANYCSSCFAIVDDPDCTKQIFAQMDAVEDAAGNTVYKHAYGFHWVPGFKPLIRAQAEFHSSKYPSEVDDHVYNSGTHKITSAELQKTWDFAVGQLAEFELDAIRVIARADQVGVFEDVNNDPTSGDYYHSPSKDITPGWPKGQKPSTVDVEIELQKKFNEAVFNRNRW